VGDFDMTITMEPIGFVHTEASIVPRHWTVSDTKGTLVINEKYQKGLKDIKAGQRIVVIFHFHKSPAFTPELLIQKPPHSIEKRGVFSISSPKRPNPVGMSVLDVIGVDGNIIYVRGLDMFEGTPILDLKPHVVDKFSRPGSRQNQEPDHRSRTAQLAHSSQRTVAKAMARRRLIVA
jgi:tRNA-Thr(GGU) m(6)t(6)A37 methyltransferase TsaA